MLKITSKAGLGKGSHYHIVFLDESGQMPMAVTSEAGPKNNRHVHSVTVMPDGSLAILPAADGHGHDEVMEYERDYGFEKQKDEDIILEIKTLYKEACEIEKDSVRLSTESEEFYKGNQWPPEIRRKLESLDRACITYNLIGKQIDTLRGIQTQQRTEITYLPQEGSDQIAADIYNIVSKHVLAISDFDQEESLVFEDQVIAGRGNFNIYVSFDNSLEGDIRVEKFDWRDVKYGPHSKKDISDAEYQFKEKMYSKAKIKQLWPKKAEEIQKDYEVYEHLLEGERRTGQQYETSSNVAPLMPTTIDGYTMVDIIKKEYRVLECWQKLYLKKVLLVHESGYSYDAEGWKDSDVEAALSIPGFVSLERNVTKFRITRVAGNIVLTDEYPANLPTDSYFTIPVYAYKKGNDFWGKIEWAKDPQREVNKRHSQAIDVVNKTANYNHFIDSTTFPNPKEKNKFLELSSSPGAVFEVTNTGRLPQKSEGSKVPSEILQLLELGDKAVTNLINVEVEFAGANEPSNRWMQRQKQKLAGNEFLFDNLSLAKRMIGRIMIPLIKKYWSSERIFRLLQSNHMNQDALIAGQPAAQYTQEDIAMALAADVNLDVVVNESESSPTMQTYQYSVLSDLAQSGQVPVPPEALIELLPGATQKQKDKLMQYLQQQQESQAQAAQATADGEIAKTLAAKGIYTPQVQQMLGGQGQQEEQPQGPEFVQDAGDGSFPTPEEMPQQPMGKVYNIKPLPDGSHEVKIVNGE